MTVFSTPEASSATTLEILETKTLTGPEQRFCAWPTLLRRKNGELLAAASGGRAHHICPGGRVHLWRSGDEGKTWSGPAILSRGPLDDRDCGLAEASDGTLVLTWFTSLAYKHHLAENSIEAPNVSPEERANWGQTAQAMDEATELRELGCWAITSNDGGQTWTEKTDTIVGSPHGPILLSDGRLLYVGKFRARGAVGLKGSPFEGRVGAAESLDGGKSWRELSDIAPMPGHDAVEYHELHAVETSEGKVVVHIRNHCEPFRQELLQTESLDGGRSWTPVRSTGLWGYPSHLTRLRDGRLLATYSHRRDPRGNRVAVSENQGTTWSEPFLLTAEGGVDFGYPSTAELGNGELLTLWYDRQPNEAIASLRLVRWRFKI